jgi:hypothetical protein
VLSVSVREAYIDRLTASHSDGDGDAGAHGVELASEVTLYERIQAVGFDADGIQGDLIWVVLSNLGKLMHALLKRRYCSSGGKCVSISIPCSATCSPAPATSPVDLY